MPDISHILSLTYLIDLSYMRLPISYFFSLFKKSCFYEASLVFISISIISAHLYHLLLLQFLYLCHLLLNNRSSELEGDRRTWLSSRILQRGPERKELCLVSHSWQRACHLLCSLLFLIHPTTSPSPFSSFTLLFSSAHRQTETGKILGLIKFRKNGNISPSKDLHVRILKSPHICVGSYLLLLFFIFLFTTLHI